jgi:hypothetical protein
MSEAPEPRRAAGDAPANDHAWSTVWSAQQSWAGAMRTHDLAPPDAGFRDRLRNLSEAASAMRDAHAEALEAGLAWRPIEGSGRARPPYEIRPGTGRRGPDELWTRFDEAVAQLNVAGAATSSPTSSPAMPRSRRPPARLRTRSRPAASNGGAPRRRLATPEPPRAGSRSGASSLARCSRQRCHAPKTELAPCGVGCETRRTARVGDSRADCP